jgi:anaphase-promoting complex subunit 3
MGAPTQVTSTMTSPTQKGTVVPQESLEATYTSLIQEYLQVMCLDNATFLAERMVATSKTTNALYLLAVCHYRNQSPQRALMVLEDVKEAGNAATQYLTAKCCFDLDHYGRAEEAMLQQARSDYKEYKVASSTSSSTTMDDWLMETSPCPVPNGAAGLYLLGNICRRSSRKQRAMLYYRMSLQVSVVLCIEPTTPRNPPLTVLFLFCF